MTTTSATLPHTSLRATITTHVARARAWWWMRPGRAVIVDTETTDLDGEIIEIAIIDAHTGATLLNTLVRPASPINPEATVVHGITDQMCTNAPTWRELWPQVDQILSNHHLALAYNAPYDRDRITEQCHILALPAPRTTWRCIMRLDATARNGRWRKLNGGHRALGDTHAARTVLARIRHGDSR